MVKYVKPYDIFIDFPHPQSLKKEPNVTGPGQTPIEQVI